MAVAKCPFRGIVATRCAFPVDGHVIKKDGHRRPCRCKVLEIIRRGQDDIRRQSPSPLSPSWSSETIVSPTDAIASVVAKRASSLLTWRCIACRTRLSAVPLSNNLFFCSQGAAIAVRAEKHERQGSRALDSGLEQRFWLESVSKRGDRHLEHPKPVSFWRQLVRCRAVWPGRFGSPSPFCIPWGTA